MYTGPILPDDKALSDFAEVLQNARSKYMKQVTHTWPILRVMLDQLKASNEDPETIKVIEFLSAASKGTLKSIDLLGDAMCLMADMLLLARASSKIVSEDSSNMMTEEFRDIFHSSVQDAIHRANKIADSAIDLHSDLKATAPSQHL